MNIYVPLHASRGVNRVATALRREASTVTLADDTASANLVVLHVIGRRDALTRTVAHLKKRGQQYALIQYCLRSTMEPHTSAWRELWRDAACVWSYYDLAACIKDDGGPPVDFNFYYAPLGVDAAFYREPLPRRYIIGTHGSNRLTESIREAWIAAKHAGGNVFHLGNTRIGNNLHVTSVTGLRDEELATSWAKCDCVAGLRRTEGFELPAAEGACCGTRPVMFDAPHYRAWFDGVATFIPEGTRPDVETRLHRLLLNGVPQMSTSTQHEAQRRFEWAPIVNGFWERLS